MDRTDFLPVTKADMDALGWDAPDFVYVCGDAYVDHPSFGAAVICRVLEDAGYRVAFLAQPNFKNTKDFMRFGRPKLAFLVSSGNVDSMVAHYSVSKKRRTYDYYSPGGKMGLRPDRAATVYSKRIREAYGKDVPIILGGLEASLRRFSHYDYWADAMHKSILVESGADMVTYGMGEAILLRLAELLSKGIPIHKIRDVRGTVWLGKAEDKVHFDFVQTPPLSAILNDKKAYAEAFRIQYEATDSVRGKAVIEWQDDETKLVQNPPMPPLEQKALDRVYELPYARTYHPDYEEAGGVPAIAEVRFSITHNRGCFGACHFCAIAFHQGKEVRARSAESVLKEAELIAKMPDFKGYIHDVGGPTANFRGPACKKQLEHGTCKNKRCLSPTPCKNLEVDHSEYAAMLREMAKIKGIKKVFVRSGIRFDYLLLDKDPSFFEQLVTSHVSGQLKVAPEHCVDHTLTLMGKPPVRVYETFKKKYFALCEKHGLKQYLVPYLMSSHPGTTLQDAVEMALWLKKEGLNPEQVQDFYPTPGTVSTVMYATGIHPLTGERIPVCRDSREKALQRALLQRANPKNAPLIREALRQTGNEHLIGFGKHCLVAPERGAKPYFKPAQKPQGKNTASKKPPQNQAKKGGKPTQSAKFAAQKPASHKPNANKFAKSPAKSPKKQHKR